MKDGVMSRDLDEEPENPFTKFFEDLRKNRTPKEEREYADAWSRAFDEQEQKITIRDDDTLHTNRQYDTSGINRTTKPVSKWKRILGYVLGIVIIGGVYVVVKYIW
jgi:hypothetical protein